MTVAHTSIKAYQEIKDELNNKQSIVYETLKELGVASNEELATELHWPINCVTGRMTELRDKGFAVVHGLTINKSGHSAKTWCPVDINDVKLKKING